MNVLILPPTETGEAVAELLRDWSAARLLEPFCLWTAGTAGVRRIVVGEASKLTLGDALAGADLDAIACSAFYPAADGEKLDADFGSAAEACMGVAALVIDFDPTHPLHRTLVVAPATARQAVPGELFRPGWSGLYVAPEDRSRPGASDQLEGGNERFIRHAAHAVATICDLWATPPASRPELLGWLAAQPAGPDAAGVRVVRCFSRVVELGYAVDHIAATAFSSEGGWPRPEPERFDRATDPERVIAHLSSAYTNKHRDTLRRRRFEPIERDDLGPMTLMQAFKFLLEQFESWRKQLPLQLVDEIRKNLHRRIARYVLRIFGIEIKPWEDLRKGERGLDSVRDELERTESLEIEDRLAPETWRDLRRIAFGLIDGSELPDGVGGNSLDRNHRRTLVCDPAWIARRPGDDDDERDTPVPLLDRVHTELVAAAASARARAAALDVARDKLASDGDPGTKNPPPPAGGWRRWFAPLSRRSRRRQEASRDQPLLGSLRRVGYYTAFACLLIVFALLRLKWSGLFAIPPVLLLWFVLSAGDARRVLIGIHEAEAAAAARDLLELNLTLERLHVEADATRLERRLAELETWMAIIAELVHWPWVGAPIESLELSEPVDEETLPAACTVAVARPDRTVVELLGGRARAVAFNTGWLSAIYRGVEDSTMAAYNDERGIGGIPPDPAADLSTDEDAPRQALLAAVERGDGRRLWESPVATELLEAIDATPIDDLAPSVEQAGWGRRPLGPTTAWVAPPEGIDAVVAQRGAAVVAVGGGAGVVVGACTVLSVAGAVERARDRAVKTADGRSAAIAGVSAIADTGLVVVHCDGDLGIGEPPPVAGRHARGAAVVAWHPLRPGDVRWGVVAGRSGSAAVAYDSAHSPVPGTPLFDLDGLLVALQAEPGRALPIVDLEGLLASAAEPGDEETDVDGVASNGHDPTGGPNSVSSPAVAATVFLAAIAKAETKMLPPVHWVEAGDANAVERVLPPAIDLSGAAERVASLSGGAAFMRPLRVTTHRVEVTAPAAATALASCAPVTTR
jgi:hypothetical protein